MIKRKARKARRRRRPKSPAQQAQDWQAILPGVSRRERAHLINTAYHEAGHASATLVTQLERGRHWPVFDCVLIRTLAEIADGPYLDLRDRKVHAAGLVEGPNIYNPMGATGILASSELWEPDRQSALQQVVVNLAGAVAEARRRHLPLGFMYATRGNEDHIEARACALDLAQDEDGQNQIVERAQREARRILNQHWDAVAALANALLSRRRLDADEVLRLIGPMIGWPPERIPAAAATTLPPELVTSAELMRRYRSRSAGNRGTPPRARPSATSSAR